MMFSDRILDLFFSSRNKKRSRLLSEYADILKTHFPYFTGLSDTEQNVFLQRVYRFIKGKNFIHIGLEEQPETEVLISAAAIQVSFGLKEYRFNFFCDIYIIKDAYTYGFSNIPWAGHVNRKGIHISWKHFKHGYAISNDRYNVGLHEMAHALEYEFTMGDYSYHDYLKTHFANVMNQIGNLVSEKQLIQSNIFTEQGMMNKHECWAESIELFFENPHELYNNYPALYEAISLLLNQDPVNMNCLSQKPA